MGTKTTTDSGIIPIINHGRTWPVVTFLEETDLAATKNEEGIDFAAPFGAMSMTLDVTAASGTTPTLDVIVEHSHDGTTWATLGSFTQATGVTSETKTFGPCRRFARGKATVGGTTPKFTFTLSGPLDMSFI